jgi:hypothetical protein
MTSNARTARCGPACRVVWQGRLRKSRSPYADVLFYPSLEDPFLETDL